MENVCQSCGMPMGKTTELCGTEKDGVKSTDYCSYCYADGAFLAEINMAEMIEICVPPMVEANPDISEDKARTIMNAYFPTLKRWK